MTTETILTTQEILHEYHGTDTDFDFARAIEQAVLQSPVVRGLRDALGQYADPNNWEKDEFGCRRIWREPGSTTPEAYDGYELALAALAAMEQQT